MSQRWIRSLVGLGLTLLMLVSVWLGDRPELAERLELDLYDLRLKSSLLNEQDPRIVIVDVDEPSLAAEGQWPWSREKLALLVRQLTDYYGVALVGLDMVFSEADKRLSVERLQQSLNGQTQFSATELQALFQQADPDRAFARAIADRPVVMGYLFNQLDAGLAVGRTGPAAISGPVPGIQAPLAQGYVGNLSALQANTLWGGFFDNPLVDSDGTYRRVPLLQQYQDDYYPSLALASLLALLGETEVTPIIERDINNANPALVAIDAGGIRIPVDHRSAALVPYRGPMGSFPYVSATDVLSGRADPAVLEGAIILVGTSAAGLLDLRVTPLQNRYPGVEVHANLLSGMLDERLRHQPDYTIAVELSQLLITGLLISLLVPRLSVLWGSLLTLAWALSLLAANLYAWNQLLWVIPLAYSLLLTLLLYLFQLSTGYFFETRNRQRLASQFGQYIPAEIVDELNARGGEVELEGESREMTVFFSDVRGFTGLSEQLNPQQLTRLMNIYLTRMTAIIYRHRGTVDKYIGDAVMAFWGAPIADPLHQRQALDAAMAMLAAMDQVNRDLEQQGLPQIAVGMGINSGRMNVGNMGSSYRMAYTVMGDAVNLGSRLEGLTKFYGVALIVSDALADAVPEYLFLELDRVQVKGRSEPVVLYQPLGLAEQQTTESRAQVALFAAALAQFRNCEWQACLESLELLERQQFNPQLLQIYRQRIADYQQLPPPEKWDGVFVHTSK